MLCSSRPWRVECKVHLRYFNVIVIFGEIKMGAGFKMLLFMQFVHTLTK